MSRAPFLPLLALVTLASGCAPKDGDRKPVPAGYEGSIEFSRFTQYQPALPVEVFLYAQAEFFFDIENQWLDAGKRVELLGPGGDVELVRTQVPGKVVYQKEQGTDIDPALFVPGSTYGMDVAGSSRDYGVPGFELAGAFTLPQAFALSTPDISGGEVVIAVAQTDLTLAWTPGDGENVEIIFGIAPTGGGTADYLIHTVADDGSFDVPAAGLLGLPTGAGVLTIARKITTPLVFPEEGTGEGLGSDAIQCVVTVQ